MICDSCKIDRLVTDFINNQKFCYRCEYRKKLVFHPEKKIEKKQFCRTCKKEIIHVENAKKRQRTVFCSLECAEDGHTFGQALFETDAAVSMCAWLNNNDAQVHP